jgi:hypothetical protein
VALLARAGYKPFVLVLVLEFGGAVQLKSFCSTTLQLATVLGCAEIFAPPAKRLAFGGITPTGELGETLSI